MKKILALIITCAFSLLLAPSTYASSLSREDLDLNETSNPQSSTPVLSDQSFPSFGLDESYDIENVTSTSPNVSDDPSINDESFHNSFSMIFHSTGMQEDPHEIAPEYVHKTIFHFWPMTEAILLAQHAAPTLQATYVFNVIGGNWHTLMNFLQLNNLSGLLHQRHVPSMIAILFLRHLQADNPLFQSASPLISRGFVSTFVERLQYYGFNLPTDNFIPAMIVQLILQNLQDHGFHLSTLSRDHLLNLVVHFFLTTQGLLPHPALHLPAFPAKNNF